MNDNTDTPLLDALLSSAEPEPTPAPEPSTRDHVTVEENGVCWRVDPVTGLGTRLTPLPARSATRKLPAMTRQFPPLEAPATRDRKALLASIAANPFHSQMLVHLLAGETADRGAALNELARLWPGTSAEERERVARAYVEVKT